MEKYRKPDQFYIDQYDRTSISILEELERNELDYSGGESDGITAATKRMKFHDTGARRAQEKGDFIRRQMEIDEKKDRLVQRYPIPQNIRCHTCKSRMEFTDHLFKQDDTLVLFVFSCPNNHIPRRAIYPNGDEFYFPIRSCIKCSGKISFSKEHRDNQLVLIDGCIRCGHQEVTEFDLNDMAELPISDEDRKEYCTSFVRSRTLEQTVIELGKLHIHFEKKEKIKEAIQKVEWLTVPQLEQRLCKVSEDLGFIKLAFEKPELKRFVTLSFSVQDPSGRKAQESTKLLKAAIEVDLKSTNWKLISKGISYRLGVLEGTLKAQEQHDYDLV